MLFVARNKGFIWNCAIMFLVTWAPAIDPPTRINFSCLRMHADMMMMQKSLFLLVLELDLNNSPVLHNKNYSDKIFAQSWSGSFWNQIKLSTSLCHWGTIILRSQRFWQSAVHHGSVSFNSLAVNLKSVVGLWELAHCDSAHVTVWHDGWWWALRRYISLCTNS